MGNYIGNLSFDERNAAIKVLANQAGIRLPDTRVPEGESLLHIGVENQRKLGADIASLPTLGDGLLAMRSKVQDEKALDIGVPIQLMRMSPTRGGLFCLGEDESKVLGYTQNGFNHFAEFIKPASCRQGFVNTLLALPPSIRADAVNHFATTSTRSDVNTVVLRTSLAPSESNKMVRVVRAVTSEKYVAVDDVPLLDIIQSAVPAGCKVRITRGQDRTDVELLWPALERQLQVGDIAVISLRITNSETKQSGIHINPQLLRVLCYNFTTAWSSGAESEVTIRHIGEAKTKLGMAIVAALRVVEPFVKAFGDAYKSSFPTFAPTRGEVLKRFKAAYELPEHLISEAAQLWDADGAKSAGDSLAGLVNAVTRASQTSNMEKSAVVEQAAGKLIANGWSEIE